MSVERGANLDRFSGLSPEGAGLAGDAANRMSGEAANMRNVGLGYAQLGQQGQIAQQGLALRKQELQADIDQQSLDRQFGLQMSALNMEHESAQRDLEDALKTGTSDIVQAQSARIAAAMQKKSTLQHNFERIQALKAITDGRLTSANLSAMEEDLFKQTHGRDALDEADRRNAAREALSRLYLQKPEEKAPPVKNGTAPASSGMLGSIAGAVMGMDGKGGDQVPGAGIEPPQPEKPKYGYAAMKQQQATPPGSAVQGSAKQGQEGPPSKEGVVGPGTEAQGVDPLDEHVRSVAQDTVKAYLQPANAQEDKAIEVLTQSLMQLSTPGKVDEGEQKRAKQMAASAVQTLVQGGHTQREIGRAFSLVEGASRQAATMGMIELEKGKANAASGVMGPDGKTVVNPMRIDVTRQKGEVAKVHERVARLAHATNVIDGADMTDGTKVLITPYANPVDPHTWADADKSDYHSVMSQALADLQGGETSVDFNDPKVVAQVGGPQNAKVIQKALEREQQRIAEIVKRSGVQEDGSVHINVLGNPLKYKLSELGPAIARYEAQIKELDNLMNPQRLQDERATEAEKATRPAREKYRNRTANLVNRLGEASKYLERNKPKIR